MSTRAFMLPIRLYNTHEEIDVLVRAVGKALRQ